MIYAFKYDGERIQKESRTPPKTDWWLSFDSEKHRYVDSDGYEYISVTTWLSAIDESPFNAARQAVECAAQRTGDYSGLMPNDIMALWEDTAVVGSALHAAVEAGVKGLEYDERFRPQVEELLAWRDVFAGRAWLSETILWSKRYHVAGMFDLIALHEDGRATMYDIKTYKQLTWSRTDKASKQLSMGALMWEEVTGQTAETGGILCFEDYYRRRRKTRMKFVKCKDARSKLEPHLWARELTARQEEEYSMAIKLTGGILDRPKRIVLHGTEGIGKSTFASEFPGVAVADLERSTGNLDVQRLPEVKSWNAWLDLLEEIKKDKEPGFKTLAVDTIDWAEHHAMEIVARMNNVRHFADLRFGKGDKALAEEFMKMIHLLNDIQDQHGMTVVLLAHTWVKRFDAPLTQDPYERFEMRLTKHVRDVVSQWADMILFANTIEEVKKDDKDILKKTKAVGDATNRVVYTQKHDAYDAKNRHGLPPSLPFTLEKMGGLVKFLLDAKVTKKGGK